MLIRLQQLLYGTEREQKKAENQLGDTKIYGEVPNDAKPNMKLILNGLENAHKSWDVCTDTLSYFIIKDANLSCFIFFQNFIKDSMLYQVGQFALIENIILKIFLRFWFSIYNQLPKKSNHISKTQMIS